MTYRILKSQIFPGFDAAVAAFARDMRDWREQEKKATEHDGKPSIAAIDRWVHRKRPVADPRVMQAVNEDDVADFEVINDDPSSAEILASKKTNLIVKVSAAEMMARQAVLPLGRQRLFTMRQIDIEAADAKHRHNLAPSMARIMAVSVGLVDPIDIEAKIARLRPDEDTRFLADHAARLGKIDTITRAAAQMHSDIEDLTLENIDAWKIPDFPK